MVKVKELKFSTSLGVLYALKQVHKHETLKQTYEYLGKGDFDTIYEVLCIAYNKQNNESLTVDAFMDVLDNSDIGFVQASKTYAEIIEGIMYNGLSKEEIENQKKLAMSQIKN